MCFEQGSYLFRLEDLRNQNRNDIYCVDSYQLLQKFSRAKDSPNENVYIASQLVIFRRNILFYELLQYKTRRPDRAKTTVPNAKDRCRSDLARQNIAIVYMLWCLGLDLPVWKPSFLQ